MDKEKVITILEYYSDIDGHIKTYKALLGDLEDYYHPLGAMNYDGLPKGINNVSHITENTALNIPDFVHKDIKYYEAQIEELFQLKTEILKEVSKLEYRHKTIIFDFYLNKMKWEQVSSRNNYSERQCKNIRNEALEKINLKFSQNRVISKFKVAA